MKILAGVDEVGRGSLIGPVYAAAVILNKSINKRLLKDSKSLTKDQRNRTDARRPPRCRYCNSCCRRKAE